MKVALGSPLAFTIGVVCRLSAVPLPAPPRTLGTLLIVAMTVGFLVADLGTTQWESVG